MRPSRPHEFACACAVACVLAEATLAWAQLPGMPKPHAGSAIADAAATPPAPPEAEAPDSPRADMREFLRLAMKRGDFEAAALVLATGGLSIPKMGATGFAHDTARRFDLRITQTWPALVPFTAQVPELAGVSLPVVARCGRDAFAEAMLFTHRGLSGPAILQISSYWRPGQEVAIDLLPDLDAVQFLKQRRHARPKAELRTILGEVMPQRLAAVLESHPAERLNDWRLTPTGTEGYAKAEVTLGGVDTDELSSRTMEARKVPGLFVIGEAVDVTGWLGGYNFQWAWSSGWVAGEAV